MYAKLEENKFNENGLKFAYIICIVLTIDKNINLNKITKNKKIKIKKRNKERKLITQALHFFQK